MRDVNASYRTVFVPLILLAIAIALPFVVPTYYVQFASKALIMGILAMALNLVVGFGGLVSLCHAAFFGIAGYALALLSTIPPGDVNLPVSLKAGEIALAVLKRNPEHPGANHYALHAFDDGEHAARALQAARTYARIAPASSHARHMPSHVFLPLGMWD